MWKSTLVYLILSTGCFRSNTGPEHNEDLNGNGSGEDASKVVIDAGQMDSTPTIAATSDAPSSVSTSDAQPTSDVLDGAGDLAIGTEDASTEDVPNVLDELDSGLLHDTETTVVAPTEPLIPQITGDCPVFETGTFSFSDVSGEMEVGPKMDGTGSLVFYWHGTIEQASQYKAFLGPFIQDILSQGGIVVAIQGSPGMPGGDPICSGTAIFIGDFIVVDQIVACAIRDHGVDSHRIYSTGCSAGGYQSGCMAFRRSSYLAAAVSYSGGLTVPLELEDDKRIPSVMTVHGRPVDMSPFSAAQTSETLDSEIKNAGGIAVNCDHGGEYCGASEEVRKAGWRFMKDHPFGIEPEPYASGLPATFPDYCEIF